MGGVSTTSALCGIGVRGHAAPTVVGSHHDTQGPRTGRHGATRYTQCRTRPATTRFHVIRARQDRTLANGDGQSTGPAQLHTAPRQRILNDPSKSTVRWSPRDAPITGTAETKCIFPTRLPALTDWLADRGLAPPWKMHFPVGTIACHS